jgi:hypothetical protein
MAATQKGIRRLALINFVASIVGCVLCAYLFEKWRALPENSNFGATGWTLLFAACVVGLASFIYLLLACLMRFRYVADIPLEKSTKLRLLNYGEQAENLLVVWYANGLWITTEK